MNVEKAYVTHGRLNKPLWSFNEADVNKLTLQFVSKYDGLIACLTFSDGDWRVLLYCLVERANINISSFQYM